MARTNNKLNVRDISTEQLTFDMNDTMTGNPPSHGSDETSGATDATQHVLAQASEALDELRDLAAKVDNQGLNLDKQAIASGIKEGVNEAQEEDPLLSELLQNKQDEALKSIPSEKQKVGDVLRAARLAGNFALEDIATEIKIKPQHLQAIEESRFGDLPSRTYAVGFVRAYANTLNLDADALVAECRREVTHSMPLKQPAMIMPEAVAEQPLPSSSLVILTAAAAFFLTALGYVFTRDTVQTPSPAPPPALQQQALQQPPVQQPVPQPVIQQQIVQPQIVQQPVAQQPVQQQPMMQQQAVPQNSALQNVQPQIVQPQIAPLQREEPANVDVGDVDTTHVSSGFLQKGLVAPTPPQVAGSKPAAPSRIKLKAVEETTVQIFDGTGRMIAERVINKGEAFYVPDKAGLTLATTNAGALHMQIDGKEMHTLGDRDEAMHNIPLNPDSLLKYLQ